MSKSKKHIPEWSRRWWHTLDYDAGSGLDRTEVKNLERILTADPDYGIARLLLAGYYQRALYEKPLRVRAASEYINHLLWLIDNDPANPDLEFATIPSDTSWFDQVKAHWHKAIRNNPDNVQVLVSAAHFFQLASVTSAEKLWKRVLALDPQGDYYRQLSFLYRLHASNPRLSTDKQYAKKSIANFKMALEAYARHRQESHQLRYLNHDFEDLQELARKFGLESEGQSLKIVFHAQEWASPSSSEANQKLGTEE